MEKITKQQLKVVFALCDDLKPSQVAKKLDISLSSYGKIINELKDIYEVKTVHGIVYQHFIQNQE